MNEEERPELNTSNQTNNTEKLVFKKILTKVQMLSMYQVHLYSNYD